jgi:alpha-L-fucosidase
MRFLTTPTTFCIVTFATPSNGTVVINKRLPILEGDEIVYLSSTAESLPWMMDAKTGQMTIDVSAVQSGIKEGEFAWAFEVRYAYGG